MNTEILKKLNIDNNFLSFLNSLNSPVVICDLHYEIIWSNQPYKNNQNKLPCLSQLKKSNFQKIIVQNETLGYIYKYEVEVSQKVKNIAHDFNNILSTIINSAEALKLKLKKNSNLHNYIKTIENNAHRAAEITEELLPARGIANRRKKINSEKLILELYDAIRQTFPQEILIKTNIGDFKPDLFCNQAGIYRSLLNICINAKEAIEGKGEINISLEKAEDHFLKIIISDTGKGIEKTSLDKIFDSGFSTKQKNRESGLGLNIVKEIIENHGGSIKAESTPGAGTTFTVLLPYISEEKKPNLSAGTISNILIADDEIILRELLAELLEANEYNVFQAGTGFEAINIFEKEKIDLLIIDRKMPELSGLDCIQKIREINSGVPVILASGSQPEEYEVLIKKLNISKVLNKPYDFEQMKLIIEELH